jgi:hypothetical protein
MVPVRQVPDLDAADRAPADTQNETRDAEPGLSRAAIVRRRIAALGIGLALVTAGLVYRSDRVVRADGRLAPKRWAEIRADGPGEVRARLKRRGDPVHANEAVALLALEGDEAAVTAAEGDLAVARRQLKTVAHQLDRMAEHSVFVPPPSVLDLGVWLELQVRSRAPAARLVAGATARMQSIRSEVQSRAGHLLKRGADAAGNPARRVTQPVDRALESMLARDEAQILDALRLALAKGPLVSLDRAMARYEDAIFAGLCDVAQVPPPVVRDVFAALGPVPAPGEPGQPPGADGLRTSDGYFELQSEHRRTQLEIRQLEAETANLTRLRAVFPALTGERHGERKAVRQALEEFVARSQEARRRREDGLGHDGEPLRAQIHRSGESLLDGVEWAWARVGEGSVSGLADLENQVSQLRLRFSALEWALDRQLAAISSHSEGLIGRNALEEQSNSAEQQASLFLDAMERLRISAEELLGKRVGEVDLALAQKQGTLEVVRARLREAMAAADSAANRAPAAPTSHDASGDPAHLSDEQQPLETARARYASSVARAEWALKAAKLALEAKVVRAPMDGVITSVGLQERTTLARNEVVGLVEDLDGLVFKALVPERELGGVAVGQRVHLSIDVDNHRQSVEGRVSWIGRGGLVFDQDQRSWNVLVTVDEGDDSLMPALLGRAEIVVGKPSGLERLRELMRPSPPPVRHYLNPELPDPTRVLPLRPEPAPSAPGEQEEAVAAGHDSLATSPPRLVERRGGR